MGRLRRAVKAKNHWGRLQAVPFVLNDPVNRIAA